MFNLQLLDRDDSYQDDPEYSKTRSPLHLAVRLTCTTHTLDSVNTAVQLTVLAVLCVHIGSHTKHHMRSGESVLKSVSTGISWPCSGSGGAAAGEDGGGSKGRGGQDPPGPGCPPWPHRLCSYAPQSGGITASC